nr:uncharacterized protein LOC109407729 [Aedes albopictus]XP_029724133.1 uncharacterized protein LOC115264528 [Aedes albopictus]
MSHGGKVANLVEHSGFIKLKKKYDLLCSQFHVYKGYSKLVCNIGEKGPILGPFSLFCVSLGGASGECFTHRSSLATSDLSRTDSRRCNLPRVPRTDRSSEDPVFKSSDRPQAHKTGHVGNAVVISLGVGHCSRPPLLAIVRWPLSAPVTVVNRHCFLPSHHPELLTSFFESIPVGDPPVRQTSKHTRHFRRPSGTEECPAPSPSAGGITQPGSRRDSRRTPCGTASLVSSLHR